MRGNQSALVATSCCVFVTAAALTSKYMAAARKIANDQKLRDSAARILQHTWFWYKETKEIETKTTTTTTTTTTSPPKDIVLRQLDAPDAADASFSLDDSDHEQDSNSTDDSQEEEVAVVSSSPRSLVVMKESNENDLQPFIFGFLMFLIVALVAVYFASERLFPEAAVVEQVAEKTTKAWWKIRK